MKLSGSFACALTYLWEQTAGPAVTPSDPSASQPALTFTVTNVGRLADQDRVEITMSFYSIYLPWVVKN